MLNASRSVSFSTPDWALKNRTYGARREDLNQPDLAIHRKAFLGLTFIRAMLTHTIRFEIMSSRRQTNRRSRRAFTKKEGLIVFDPNLKVTSWVTAYGTFFRGCGPFEDKSAVSAFPFSRQVFLEHFALFHVC